MKVKIKAFFFTLLFLTGLFFLIVVVAILNNIDGNIIPILVIILVITVIIFFSIYGLMIPVDFHFHTKNYKKCKFYLRLILFPQLLLRSVKPSYFLYKGFMEENDKKFDKAEIHCRRAIEYGFKNPKTQAFAYCFLAELLIDKNQFIEAKLYLDMVKDIPHIEELDALITKLEEKIS